MVVYHPGRCPLSFVVLNHLDLRVFPYLDFFFSPLAVTPSWSSPPPTRELEIMLSGQKASWLGGGVGEQAGVG